MAPKGRGRQAAPAAAGTTIGSIPGSSVEDANANTGGTAVGGADNPSDDTSAQLQSASSKPRTRGSSEPRTPSTSAIQQEQRFGKRGSGQAFALGLFQILKTEDPSIIGWSPSGKAFRIEDSERFCRDIMPRFFKQNKYSSFQRQLNLYGFRKLVRGEEAGGYMHPLFERGKPEQLSQVRRGFFPEIPPEFAHDVHGHGLSESTGDNAGGAANGSHPRAAPRGRKAEASRANPGSNPASTNGPGSRAPAPAAAAARSGGLLRARSSSVGRSGRIAGIIPAAAAAAAAVTAASVPTSRGVLSGETAEDHQSGRESPAMGGAESARVARSHGDGHVTTGSGSELRKHVGGDHGNGGMAMDTEWEGIDGPLPSLDSVTGGLGLPRGHVNAVNQPGGAELPPTLGRLVPSAENPLSRESSPLKAIPDSDGRMHGGAQRRDGSVEGRDRHDGHIPYGRSQDDLSLSPRTNIHFPTIMGMYGVVGGAGGYDSVAGIKTPNSFYNGSNHGAGLGAAADYFGSNGSIGSGGSSAPRGQRQLQHMHSRDDLDTLRPRKTRRTGASFHGQADDDGHEPPAFFAGSPRAREVDRVAAFGGGRGGEGVPQDGSSDNGIPFRAAAAVYAAPDEVPPAPPRRLVSHHNTPSRPERSGGGNGKQGPGRGSEEGGGGGAGASNEGKGVHVAHLDTNVMDTDPGTSGGMTLRKDFNLAASGFYATVSPVAVSAARGSFPGGRRHHRHPSNSAVPHGSVGSSPPLDTYGVDGQHRGSAWKAGEGSPDLGPQMRGESPAPSRPGGGTGGGLGVGVGGVAGGGGGGVQGAGGAAGSGMGGLGLTAHAMSRMEQVKASRQDNMALAQGQADGTTQHPAGYRNGAHVNGVAGSGVQHGGNGVGVQALGEDLSQLDLGETRGDPLNRAPGADGMPNRPNGPKQRGMGHDNPGTDAAGGGVGHKRSMETSGSGKGNGAEWGGGRRPAAAEAAELLRRRSSVDEVIGLLSKSTGDNGSFEDESMKYQHDPAQFDSWRNSLTKVLGHLGFDLEDEQGVPPGAEGKRSPTKRTATRAGSQYLSWGGTAAMSFEDQPEEFHESLRQIPMRWRSSLSSIMTSMASNGGGIDDDSANGADGGRGISIGANSDGKGGCGGTQGKRLEQQASLEMLQSVMRETLESMSTGTDPVDAEDGEEEAKAAAAAALAMGSMCRASTNERVGSVDAEMGDIGGDIANTGPAKSGRGGSLGGDVLGNAFDSTRPLADPDSHPHSAAPLDHGRNSHLRAPRYPRADPYYDGHGGHMQGVGGAAASAAAAAAAGQYMAPISVPVSGGMGGVGMPHGDRHTSL